MSSTNRVQAVIFDLDGVLVMTEALKAAAHVATVNAFGGELDLSIYGRWMGKAHDLVRDAFIAEAGIQARPEEYTDMYRKTYQRLMESGLRTTPGAKELLTALEARAYRLAMVTSSKQWMVDEVLTQLGLGRYFEVVVSADDVEREKPEPDAYLLALKKLRMAAAEAVVVEDSEPGVRAARGAGIRVIAVRHEFNGLHDFSNAEFQLDSLAATEEVVGRIEQVLSGGSGSTPHA